MESLPRKKSTVCNILMIDVKMKEINCKHNAKCLNFYLYTVSCRFKISGTPDIFDLCLSDTVGISA